MGKPKSGENPDVRARRLYSLALMYALGTVAYYFGEIINFFGWDWLRWDFFYGVHDVHRLLFLGPIIYSGYYFGTRATIIVTIVTANTFLPRALLVSPYPDPLLRMMLFVVIAGILGYLTARVQRDVRRYRRMAATAREERDRLRKILGDEHKDDGG